MNDTNEIPLQPASLDIWGKKYRLTAKDGGIIDKTMDDTFKRIAKALSEVEQPRVRDGWYENFLWALRRGAIPAGRIISNAGAWSHKPATSTINCTVSGTIHDSMDDILAKVHEGGLTLKAGAGVGYEFSTLRPKGAYVSGAGATTSGPLSFMDIYDKMCFTVASAGGRRGAQMATFDVGHPDVLDIIQAKREAGRLRQFNISLLITEEFMEAVKADAPWHLAFPMAQEEARNGAIDTLDLTQVVWRKWPVTEGYVTHKGYVACRIYKTLPARELWDVIMRANYDYAEPGFILIDKMNEENNNWWCEDIRATNPCGEQGLPPYGACLLGSINLTQFVEKPFEDGCYFDYVSFERVVDIFTRMLDNVVEINGLPLEQQRYEILRKRRHGMGYMGLGSALAMLRIPYDDNRAIWFTEEVTKRMAITGWKAGLALAQEKGPAPLIGEMYTVSAEMIAKRPEMEDDGWKVGDQIPGSVLFARYSRYMQRIREVEPSLVEDIERDGCRFTHHTSIAPTGTIALSMGNNVSNGIEPSFSHQYSRNIIREGKKSKEKVEVYSYELLAYRTLTGKDDIPDYFAAADTISPQAHINIQAAAQKWIDSSISKTTNVPTDYPYEDFKGIYLYAYEQGLKGCTTFRYNPENFQGVLVKEKDLAATTYRFVLEDGTTVDAKGNETIEYDGETHSAANLYDALKEGYYGKW